MANSAKILGYGGSAVIDGLQVLITGGTFDDARTISYLDMLDIPPSASGAGTSRSRVKHADGTRAYSGSVNFDASEKTVDLFSIAPARLLTRRYQFNVGINDGESSYAMTNCYITSISLSGSPAGLISASIGFVATTGKSGGAVSNNYILNYSTDPTDQPAAYWWSGNTDVRDWTFSFNQDAVPVYSNEDVVAPRYIRVGLIGYSLQMTTYSELDHDDVSIITKAFTLTGDTNSKTYSFNGPTDLGMYSHSFETAASAATGSDGTIIT